MVRNRLGEEVIIAGGLDTQLSYMRAKEFGDPKGRVHKVLPFRQDAVCCAAESRLIACTQHRTVNIWALGSPKVRKISRLKKVSFTLRYLV